MERGNMKFSSLISIWHLLTIFLFICILSANSTQVSSDTVEDVVCALINCGHGKCVASNTSLFLGFDCVCNPGWKKIQIGPLTFPSCFIPNCTLNFQCGNDAPPPPPPPPPSLPPPFNLSDPCNLVWCGDGMCVANGTGHACQCYKGSANLFDSSVNACFKECSFGADCHDFRVGLLSPPPPQPPPTSGSTDKGSNEVPNCSRNLQAVTTILLAASFLTWI